MDLDRDSRHASLTPSTRARLADIAQYYWVDAMTVEDIGRHLNLSRSTISRELARARATGVVEFVIHRAPRRPAELADALRDAFGVRADVVETQPTMGVAEVLDLVAAAADARLATMITAEMIIDVAWGSTVEVLSRHLDPHPIPGVRVVQFNGAGNTLDSGFAYASALLDRFSRAYYATLQLFPVPAFFDAASTKEAMWRERSIQRVLRARASADLLVTSVGSLQGGLPGHLYRAGYLTARDAQDLLAHGVVGDLGGIFFRDDGSSDRIGINARSTGMPLDEVSRLPLRILLASGAGKARAIRAALRAGLATHLVIDDATARLVLELDQESRRQK